MASLNTTSSTTTTTQTTTQNPQTVASQQNNLQPVNTNVSVFTSKGGLALQSKALPTAQLQATTVSTQAPTPVGSVHHSAGLTILSILLFMIAIALFAGTTRSSKSTTN